MCGITAFKGEHALYHATNATLAQLDRGKQGSGYAWIDSNSKLWYIKAPIHPLELAISQHYFISNNAKIAIGHNRMPSRGDISLVNCHPFFDCHSRFALVHNGTVMFTQEEIKTIQKSHKIIGETDTELLTHVICELLNNGLTMTQAMEEIANNRTTQATFLVLTKQGDIFASRDLMPLHYCHVENSIKGNFYAFASEKESIAMSLTQILSKKTTNLNVEFKELESGDLLHLSTDNKIAITKHETTYRFKSYEWDNFEYDTGKAWIKDARGWYTSRKKRLIQEFNKWEENF